MVGGFIESKHQAAGHDGCLISPENGAIFAKLTTQQEIDFYNETQLLSQADFGVAMGGQLSDWMAVYMGTLTKSTVACHDPNSCVIPALSEDRGAMEALLKNGAESGDDKQYIVMQNLYDGFRHPSILDVKLGSVLHDEGASEEKAKRLAEVSRTTTSGTMNFRVCGMKLYNGRLASVPPDVFPGMGDTVKVVADEEDGTNYIEFDKFFGRKLTKANVRAGIELFFGHIHSDIRKRVIETYVQRLQLLYNCLLDTEVRIISGSLLFIIDNDAEKWQEVANDSDLYETRNPLVRTDFISDDDEDEEEGDIEKNSPLSSLNFIDFAHAKYVKGQGYDENIVEGVENLIEVFEQMLSEI